jgi:LysM repeat protein
MQKKSAQSLLAVILMGVLASGCVLKASTPPPSARAANTTQTEEASFPDNTPQAAGMKEILSGTQTAAALSASEVPAETKAVSPDQTKTPKPKPSKTPTVVNQPDTSYKPDPNPKRPESYTLQAGEWPICIARRYNLDVASLLSANNLTMDSRPPAGTKLSIPQSGKWGYGDRTWHAHPVQYTVNSGDTIYSVACYFGDLLPQDITAANKLAKPYKLTAGQEIYIP